MYGSTAVIAKFVSDYIIGRRSEYGGATLKVCYINVQGIPRPLMAKLELFYKDDAAHERNESTNDYGDFVMCSYKLNMDSVLSMLSSIASANSFDPPDKRPKLSFTQNADCYLLNSKSQHAWGYHQWPYLYATFKIPEFQINASYQVLAKRGLPLYPDMYVGITEFLGLSSSIGHYSNMYQMIVVVPDFKARIDRLVISGKKVSLTVESKSAPLENLVAKIYLAKGRQSYQSEDLSLSSSVVSTEVDFEPDIVTACILDNRDDVLDLREHHLDWTQYNEDVIVEMPSNQIIELIQRGENEKIEFKQTAGEDFLEPVVSFANAEGGMILLGVDNYGKIVGYNEDVDKLRDKLASRIRSNIQPSNIKFSVQRVELEGQTLDDKKQVVIAITIYSGQSKPYYLRDKGILIRHGASDRAITPAELDEIYARRGNNNNRSPWL